MFGRVARTSIDPQQCRGEAYENANLSVDAGPAHDDLFIWGRFSMNHSELVYGGKK